MEPAAHPLGSPYLFCWTRRHRSHYWSLETAAAPRESLVSLLAPQQVCWERQITASVWKAKASPAMEYLVRAMSTAGFEGSATRAPALRVLASKATPACSEVVSPACTA